MAVNVTVFTPTSPALKVLRLDNAKHGEEFTLPAKHMVQSIVVLHSDPDLVGDTVGFGVAGVLSMPAEDVISGELLQPDRYRWFAVDQECTIDNSDSPNAEFTAWVTLVDMSLVA